MPILKLRQDHARNLPYAGKIPKQQCIYWDAALTSFGLRVYPTLKRVYVCCYRIQRRKRLAVLGRADVLSIDDARRKVAGLLPKDYISPIAGIVKFRERAPRRIYINHETLSFLQSPFFAASRDWRSAR